MTAAERAAERIAKWIEKRPRYDSRELFVQSAAAIIQQECGEGEWVSVDNPPEHERRVEVVLHTDMSKYDGGSEVDDYVTTGCFIDIGKGRRVWTHDDGDSILEHPYQLVTYWREMPKPPSPPQAAQPSAGAQPSERSE